MFITKTKIVGISGQYALEENGVLWEIKDDGEWEQIAARESKASNVAAVKSSKYSEEFEIFWKVWNNNVKNTSAKGDANKAFIKLSEDDKSLLIKSVPAYAKTEPVDRHCYLKRAAAYINSDQFQSMEGFIESSVVHMPTMDDPIWKTEIFNQDTGITEKASSQINTFGMLKSQAWALIQERIA